jgi:hypothetical protein
VEGYHAVRRRSGKDEYFAIDLAPGGKPIPSEAGTLFIYVPHGSQTVPEIVEIRCAD